MTQSPVTRCAIYTRKSTEEGLDQAFNTLDAQREACEAYVLSQAGEGWSFLEDRYDDGGYSGGTMERPALKEMMKAIKERRIDVIVVYKIDRLTRSLADFAKMVEIFDEYSVSFVSVTQAFNTTTSMGRLTLNVLLSFAQFEREVTAERIRDKIKSSKEKGIWMGGRPPLGYDVKDRQLIVNEKEAQQVQHIFKEYLAARSVLELKAKLDRDGLGSKDWITQKGIRVEGKPFSLGALYHLLQNPIYRGMISHKGTLHQGNHTAIIGADLWDQVERTLGTNRRAHKGRKNIKAPSLLAGLIYDEDGRAMTPAQAHKKGIIYRYYRVNRRDIETEHSNLHLPAKPIDDLVIGTLKQMLGNPARLLDLLQNVSVGADHLDEAILSGKKLAATLGRDIHEDIQLLNKILHQVAIAKGSIRIVGDTSGLIEALTTNVKVNLNGKTVPLAKAPIKLKHGGSGVKLVLPHQSGSPTKEPDPGLIKAIARAYIWMEELTSGRAKSIKEIAESEGIDARYVARVLRLAFLSPGIVKAIFAGREPQSLTADKLIRTQMIPLDWHDQSDLLGF